MLDDNNIPFTYIIMIADVEATDDYFCQKFATGSQKTFLGRCLQSMEATTVAIHNLDIAGSIKEKMLSSSFFKEFGQSNFMNFQHQYQSLLASRFKTDDKLKRRLTTDIINRQNLYRKMYSEVLNNLSYSEREDFLITRTIRTIAQYLALARLISNKVKYPIIINHPTQNTGTFNQRNRYLLPGDNHHPHSTIPIFKLKKAVY